MRFHLKNMVCPRCILVVRQCLEELNLNPKAVSLGNIELHQSPSPEQKQNLQNKLESLGFVWVEDSKTQIVEQIKQYIIQLVQEQQANLGSKPLSEHLSKHLLKDYSSLSHQFSRQEQMTIERFFMLQKIEAVKAYLLYENWPLSQIAEHFHYSSAAHLSRQFKQMTGINPKDFRQMGHARRLALDQISSNNTNIPPHEPTKS